jgi:uncharacterized protein YqiB (DUF1249 family)
MKIVRETLLNCLNQVSAGLSSRDLAEQTSSFIFQPPFVITFNDEISVRMKLEELDGVEGAVRAKPLLAALTNMSHEEIDVTTDEKNLIIKAPRTKVQIRREPQADPSPIDAIKPPAKKAYGDLPEHFGTAVEQVCSVTSSSNDQEFFTVAVHLTKGWIEGSDRKQFCRYTMDLPLSGSFLVRSKSLKHLAGLDVTRVAENGDWLHFRNQTLIFSVRRHISSGYPDLTRNLSFRGAKTVLPKGGIPAAKLAAAFSSENKDNDRVQVQLSDGKMVVVGLSAHGQAETTLECGYTGGQVSFWIAPKALVRLIEDFNDCEIAPEGRLSVFGEGWVYSAALSKDKEEKKDEKAKDKKQAALPMTEEFENSEEELEETEPPY